MLQCRLTKRAYCEYYGTFVKNVKYFDDSAELRSLTRQQLRNLTHAMWSSFKQHADTTHVFPGLKFAPQSAQILVGRAQCQLFLEVFQFLLQLSDLPFLIQPPTSVASPCAAAGGARLRHNL